MKSIMPWFCLVAAASPSAACANEGLDSYRQGNYVGAASQLSNTKGNDPIVDYYLGRMRLYGYGQLKNNTLAMHYFKLAAEKGFLPAQQIMGRYALLVDNDPEQALYWFKKSADANDVSAQMYCASAYLFGIGVNKNPDIAKRFYIAAARNGDSIAQYTLAASFFETRQAANKQLGLIWLNKSVVQNNPEAQVMLSALYTKGTLVERDFVKARELAGLAIAQGYVPALYQMGQIAEAQANVQEAKDWYMKAANAHFSPAEIALSHLYSTEKSPLYDLNTAFLWMLKSAQGGSVDAQVALAAMYKNGQGVEADENLSNEWHQKSLETAKGSFTTASIKAANWLSNGKASTWANTTYRLHGIFSAWTNPSVLKENNYDQPPQMETLTRDMLYKPRFVMVSPNLIPISDYYDALVASLGDLQQDKLVFPVYPMETQVADEPVNKAAVNPALNDHTNASSLQHLHPESENQDVAKVLEGQAILGDSAAQFNLGQMYQSGVGVKKDVQEAIKYYQQAVAQQDLRAEYNLGVLYLQGDGVAADPKLGFNLLSDAAFKGNPYAQYVVARIDEQGYHDAAGSELIKASREQAMSMYDLAAANNYGPAQYRLAEILVREKQAEMTSVDKQKHTQLIKELYQGAVDYGVEEAALPLAFYNALDADKGKRAQAFAAATKAANAGNADAALLLGLMYDRGIATDVSQSDALKWYQQAAQNAVSAFVLGTYLSEGTGIRKDPEKGRALLQKAADAGFSYANLNLAIMKQQKNEVFLPDLDKAHMAGNSTAGLLLADYYMSLASDDQQMKQAHDIYQHLAEKGYKDGQLKLAYQFEHGLGGAVDISSAAKWYGLAAEQGQPIAQYLLGNLYQLGWLDKQPDYVAAKKWYAAAQTKYTPAAVARGFISDTVDDDYQHALQDYQQAALQGDPVGQFNAGLIYEKGKGRPVDFVKARALYLQAAELGHRQAMVQLAGLYINGLGGSRDESQGLSWYKKAADLGDRDAYYQLGLLSETGVATKLDYPDAVHYYQLAVDKGNAKAMLALARMYQYGLGVPKDAQHAATLYKEQVLLDNPYAQYQLALFYYDGRAGERSPQQGRKLLQQAQDNGSQQARKALQWMDAQSQDHTSFIEPAQFVSQLEPDVGQSADLMYLHAINAWNRGDEGASRTILTQILTQYPDYMPAKRAYEQLGHADKIIADLGDDIAMR